MTSPGTIVVGIDGGATHTTALVTDHTGAELARARGGPGIVNPVDPFACVGRLTTLARRAIGDAGHYPPVAALCCALAGAGRSELRKAVQQELQREQVARRVLVVTDAEAGLADAFDDRPGILLIAGTGSIAWGRGQDGRLERCGGWGVLLGDEGSGYAIGLAALRAVTRAEDGRGEPTALTPVILDAAGVLEPDELIRWAAAASKADIAALAPLALAHADTDRAAGALRDDAAAALTELVGRLVDRLAPWQGDIEVALAGGLIRPGGPLRDAVTRALAALSPRLQLGADAVDAARGAARLALAARAAQSA